MNFFEKYNRLSAACVRAKAELFLGWRFSASPKKREPETDPKGHAQNIVTIDFNIARNLQKYLFANNFVKSLAYFFPVDNLEKIVNI